jgi:IS5 family transposase
MSFKERRDTLQHDVPLHSTSLTKWRKRVGADKLAEMLQETIAIAVKDKQVTPQELAQVNVDTTVQEKNITHPTDSKLYHTALIKLAEAAKNRRVRLRQNYLRVSKQTALLVSRYAHAKQFQRMRKKLKQLKTWLGRVLRDLRREVPQPDESLERLLVLCERLHAQEKNRQQEALQSS